MTQDRIYPPAREIQMVLRDRSSLPVEPELPTSKINSSLDAFQAFRCLRDMPVEAFVVLHLDGQNVPIGYHVVNQGSTTRALVPPSVIWRAVLLSGAASVLFIHNHPSGNLHASQEDRQMTQTLKSGGKLLGVNVLDHIIIGGSRYHSMQDEGEF